MSKLNELAALLKSARKPIIESPIGVDEQRQEIPVQVVTPLSPPEPTKSSLDVVLLQKEMQHLKRMLDESMRRHVVPTYSGGGSSSLSDIDRPMRNVATDYTPTTRDWYLGIGNRDQIITITLPTNIKNGREYVIKDEVGIAELVPIRIVGTIDNDPEGLELRINKGSVTLLYNNGWRII